MTAAAWRRWFFDQLGAAGMAALGLLAAAVIFLLVAVQPLEARNEQLEFRLARSARQDSPPGPGLHRISTPAAKLAAFYEFFENAGTANDCLARLHAIRSAAGVESRSAEYRMRDAGARIERYEIALPVTGSYAQIRTFLANALAEIPVLSLDQMNFSRQHVNDPRVHAELRLSLHLARP